MLALPSALAKGPARSMTPRRPPPWLIPNLLSLDAPLVAVAWMSIFARTWRVDYHPWPPYLALGLTVWGLCAADRLLDAMLHGGEGRLPLRHETHRRLRRALVVLVPLALAGTLAIALRLLPLAIFGYALGAAVMVAGFFATATFGGSHGEIPYAKNLLGGLTFAYGSAIGAHVYVFSEDVFSLLRSPEMLSFALLCSLNITAIDLWEHSRRAGDPEVGSADELTLTLPLALLAGFALLFALQAGPDSPLRPFYVAILVATAGLLGINRVQHRLPADALWLAADACLLAPWLYVVLA